jgi:two-component system sensor histidine kinase RpfC
LTRRIGYTTNLGFGFAGLGVITMFFVKVINGLQVGVGSIELEQSLLRLVLVLAGVVYAVVLVESGLLDYNYGSPIFIIGYLYIVFSVLISIYLYINPDGSRWRHTIHMSLDILVISLVMHSFEKYGIPFFAEYLWLIVGNGFRYGYKEAITCTFMSFFSFIILVTKKWPRFFEQPNPVL